MAQHIKSNDYVMVFFSGHVVKRTGEFKLLPTDYDPDFEEDTTIDYKLDVLKPLSKIEAKVIVFVGACLSGNAKTTPSRTDISKALMDTNKSMPGLITISSCSENELSYEDPEWENSAFSKALFEAISGKKVALVTGELINADLGVMDENGEILEMGNNGIIVIGELITFLKRRVQDLVKHRKGAHQTPSVPVKNLDLKLHLFTLQ